MLEGRDEGEDPMMLLGMMIHDDGDNLKNKLDAEGNF